MVISQFGLDLYARFKPENARWKAFNLLIY